MKNIVRQLFRRNKYPAQDHEIKYAFTSGSIDYYQFSDISNIPAVRGLKTMVFYEEFRMKTTLEYLKLHCEAVDNILGKQKINIFDIKKLNEQLKQRLNIAVETELIYKLASVVFFDKKEDVKDYDFAYNGKKVEHWKKHNGDDFFLLQPLQTYLPFLSDANVNFQTYSLVVEKLNTMHLENLLQNLPREKMQRLKGRSYLSAVAMPAKSEK